LSPDNVLRRCVHPRLRPLELDWINFAVLRRSHSALHKEKGMLIWRAMVEFSLVTKRQAVSALWADFRALKNE